MAGAAAWAANPFWTASAEAVKYGANKIGGGVKSLANEIYNAPKDIWNGFMGKDSFSPTAPQIDQTAANESRGLNTEARGQQGYLLGKLQEQIQGNGPTVAGIQAQQGIAQAMQNAGTQAASARGMSRALAQRTAAYGGMQAQQQANRDAALMRAQEQLSAQQQFGGVSTGMRQGDTLQRQLDLDAAKANQLGELEQQKIAAEISEGNAGRKQKGYGGIANGISAAVKGFFPSDINAKQDITPTPDASFTEYLRQSMNAQPQQAQQPNQDMPRLLDSADAGLAAKRAGELRKAENEIQAQPDSGGINPGGIGGAISEGFGAMGNTLMSDERSKERIRQLENELENRPPRQLDQHNPFSAEASRANLAPLEPYSYRYKPEFARLMADQMADEVPPEQEGAARVATVRDALTPRQGIMAQDLERSPGGRAVVKNTTVGKQLDMKRALSFALANQAGLDKRLARVEGER